MGQKDAFWIWPPLLASPRLQQTTCPIGHQDLYPAHWVLHDVDSAFGSTKLEKAPLGILM